MPPRAISSSSSYRPAGPSRIVPGAAGPSSSREAVSVGGATVLAGGQLAPGVARPIESIAIEIPLGHICIKGSHPNGNRGPGRREAAGPGGRSGPTDLVETVGWLRTQTDLPICIGFGISGPDQVRQLAPVADGLIIGSAIVRRLAEAVNRPRAEVVREIGQFIGEMVKVLENAGA